MAFNLLGALKGLYPVAKEIGQEIEEKRYLSNLRTQAQNKLQSVNQNLNKYQDRASELKDQIVDYQKTQAGEEGLASSEVSKLSQLKDEYQDVKQRENAYSSFKLQLQNNPYVNALTSDTPPQSIEELKSAGLFQTQMPQKAEGGGKLTTKIKEVEDRGYKKTVAITTDESGSVVKIDTISKNRITGTGDGKSVSDLTSEKMSTIFKNTSKIKDKQTNQILDIIGDEKQGLGTSVSNVLTAAAVSEEGSKEAVDTINNMLTGKVSKEQVKGVLDLVDNYVESYDRVLSKEIQNNIILETDDPKVKAANRNIIRELTRDKGLGLKQWKNILNVGEKRIKQIVGVDFFNNYLKGGNGDTRIEEKDKGGA